MSLGLGNIIVQPKRETGGSATNNARWTGIVGIDPELVAGTNTLTLAILIGKSIEWFMVDNVPENSLDALAAGGDGPQFTFNSATGTITRVTPDVAPVDNPWINGQKVVIP